MDDLDVVLSLIGILTVLSGLLNTLVDFIKTNGVFNKLIEVIKKKSQNDRENHVEEDPDGENGRKWLTFWIALVLCAVLNVDMILMYSFLSLEPGTKKDSINEIENALDDLQNGKINSLLVLSDEINKSESDESYKIIHKNMMDWISGIKQCQDYSNDLFDLRGKYIIEFETKEVDVLLNKLITKDSLSKAMTILEDEFRRFRVSMKNAQVEYQFESTYIAFWTLSRLKKIEIQELPIKTIGILLSALFIAFSESYLRAPIDIINKIDKFTRKVKRESD